MTCPEPPWKPALQPFLFPSSPHRPPILNPRPCHSTPERVGATLLLHSPRLTLPRERTGLSWGQSLEVATRRRAGDSRAAAGVGGEAHGPSPLPPPAAPRSPVSARRRVCHKQTQLGHTWTAELLRLATDRGLQTPGLRKPEPPGRAGKRTELTLGSGHCHLAPLPPHGSAAAAAAAALAFRGPSRQRVQALL